MEKSTPSSTEPSHDGQFVLHTVQVVLRHAQMKLDSPMRPSIKPTNKQPIALDNGQQLLLAVQRPTQTRLWSRMCPEGKPISCSRVPRTMGSSCSVLSR